MLQVIVYGRVPEVVVVLPSLYGIIITLGFYFTGAFFSEAAPISDDV